MSTITTLNATGLVALMVDKGRLGFEHLGVPVSGPFDMETYEDACFLVDEPAGVPVVEFYRGTWEFNADVDTLIAAVGDDLTVLIDGKNVGSGHSLVVPAYAFVKVVRSGSQLRGPAYIAIAGLSPELVLGSASSDTFSGLGTPQLTKDSKFPVRISNKDIQGLRFLQSGRRRHGYVPLEPGPWSSSVSEFRLTVESVSRSGIRFSSAELPLVSGDSGTVESFPVFPGAMQVPPSNAPILLGPDAGTTGGYPVVGIVNAAGMGVLSEALPGDVITFGFAEKAHMISTRASRHILN